MTHDLDTPAAPLDMVRIVLDGIANEAAAAVPLARAGIDLIDLTHAQRMEMFGKLRRSVGHDWRWYSGPNDEWYPNGPFATRDEALAALDGDAGYVIEAHPADPIRLNAEQLLEDQYFENNDSFDFDHAEPDRTGPADAIAAADAQLQALLDGWCARHAHTFARGNLFGETRNKARIEPSPVATDAPLASPAENDPAMVETHSTTPAPCPAAPADRTGDGR